MNNLLPVWTDFLIVAGAIILVALAALIWAVFFRKRSRRRHKNRRQLNLTLAQVGGLPPVRLEEKPPCQPQPTSQP
jgi:membrane protein implicated in regulation of membrane protease activity